jgi:hypothetical protein
MSYFNYSSPASTDIRYETVTGKRYFVCNHCRGINSLEDAKKNRKDTKWILLTKREIKKLFKILAANLDLSYEETLIYLLSLHEKESKGVYNAISPAVSDTNNGKN